MALSLAQFQAGSTKAAALELILDLLESEGFPARSWQEGSVNRTEVEFLAELFAVASQANAAIAEGGFNDTAEGAALTSLSASHYENDRAGATRTRGNFQLTVASGSGPYSPGIGEVIVKDPVLDIRYRSVTALTLSSGASPVTGLFEAEVAGTAGNAPTTGDVDTLVSSFAGVTVTNAADWLTVAGSEEEGDPELKINNSSKWALLSESSPKGVYEAWALAAAAAVTRVSVDDTNAQSAGAVIVYLADADAGLGSPTTETVLDYINERRELCATVTAAEANSLDVAVTYAGSHDSTVFATDADAEAAIEAALNAYRATFPVGGTGPVGSKVFPLGGLYNAANAVEGIVNVTFTAPTTDTAMTVDQVVTYTLSGASAPV